jgi:hypothetical protein
MHKLNPVGVVAHEPPLGHAPVGDEELAQTRPVAVYATGAVATEASASHWPGAYGAGSTFMAAPFVGLYDGFAVAQPPSFAVSVNGPVGQFGPSPFTYRE